MPEELSQEQKIDRIYVAVTDPDHGLRALNHRVGNLETWRNRLVGAWGTVTGLFGLYVAIKEHTK